WTMRPASPGVPTAAFCDSGSTFTLTGVSSGTTTTHRWQRNAQGSAFSAVATAANGAYTVSYFEQYRWTVTAIGTTAWNPASIALRTAFGALASGGSVVSTWQDWNDGHTQFSLSATTTNGWPTTHVRTWNADSSASVTVHYVSPLAAPITSFTATPVGNGRLSVGWTSSKEMALLGYGLTRTDTLTHVTTNLTPVLIARKGTDSTG